MGLFKSASPPPVTLPPPPPQMPVEAANQSAAYRASMAGKAGLASTIATSPQGTQTMGNTAQNQLLGS